jgi:phosphoglycerate kinase
MLSRKLTIDKIGAQLRGKKVLVRVDFNVPMKDGKIKDATRIKESLKTIQFAMDNGAQCVTLMSHMGRPNGHKDMKYTLKTVVPTLSELLKHEVEFLNDCRGNDTISVKKNLILRKLILQAKEKFSY